MKENLFKYKVLCERLKTEVITIHERGENSSRTLSYVCNLKPYIV